MFCLGCVELSNGQIPTPPPHPSSLALSLYLYTYITQTVLGLLVMVGWSLGSIEVLKFSSVYLLYWYKSTNTDAAGGAGDVIKSKDELVLVCGMRRIEVVEPL